MQLPASIAEAVQPLFDALPMEQAMAALVPASGPAAKTVALVERCLEAPALVGRKRLAAGLWLYVDELERSHVISQEMEDATGSFWHGIMHRREGDFSNCHYWFRRAGQHPVMGRIGSYDAHAFVDEVARRHASNPSALVALQRAEWQALFEYCADNEPDR